MVPTASDSTPPPAFIPVPGGPSVSGVTLFAVRLASELARLGGRVTLAMHAPPAGHATLDLTRVPGLGAPSIRVLDLTGTPPLDTLEDDGAALVPHYRRAIETLAGRRPAVMVLGQHETVFAAGAALSQDSDGTVRTIGVAHSDNGYDAQLLRRYEPMLSRLVVVSDALSGAMNQALTRERPERVRDLRMIPYGVPVPPAVPPRPPIGGRPVKLLYAGRLDHRQKRVLALPALSLELSQRGIDHEVTIAGDGPAEADLRAACADAPRVTLRPAGAPESVEALLREHDAFVLPSRFEGLSVAMLEALAQGCVPIVAPSRSGTSQAIRSGVTGEIAEVGPDADEPATALALADAIEAFGRRDLTEMSARCHARALEAFSIEQHGLAWADVLREAADDIPRPWPAGRSFAAMRDLRSDDTARRATARLRRLRTTIGDAPVAIHGSGRFAAGLASELERFNIAAVADDDRQRHGDPFLGVRIGSPETAAESGAAHVIIVSALYEDEIWARRSMYASRGLVVHRLQAADDRAASAS